MRYICSCPSVSFTNQASGRIMNQTQPQRSCCTDGCVYCTGIAMWAGGLSMIDVVRVLKYSHITSQSLNLSFLVSVGLLIVISIALLFCSLVFVVKWNHSNFVFMTMTMISFPHNRPLIQTKRSFALLLRSDSLRWRSLLNLGSFTLLQ